MDKQSGRAGSDDSSIGFAYSVHIAWTLSTLMTGSLLASVPVAIWLCWTVFVEFGQDGMSLAAICFSLREFAGNADSILTVQWLIHWTGLVSAAIHMAGRRGWRWHLMVAAGTCACCTAIAAGCSPFFRRPIMMASSVVLCLAVLAIRLLVLSLRERNRFRFPATKLPGCLVKRKIGLPGYRWPIIGLLLVTALFYSAVTLLRPICYDEMFSAAHYGRLGPVFCLGRYDFPNNHPLYSLISSLLLAPQADFRVVRPVAVVAGILSLPGVWLLASRWIGNGSAWFATAWFALHPLMIKYASEGRGYSLAICLSVWGLVAFLPREKLQNPMTAVRGAWCLGAATLVVPSWILLQGVAILCAGMSHGWRRQLRIWAPIFSFQALFGSGAVLFLLVFWRHTFFANMARDGVQVSPFDEACQLCRYLMFGGGASYVLGVIAIVSVAVVVLLLWLNHCKPSVSLGLLEALLLAVLLGAVWLISSRTAVLRQGLQAIPVIAVAVGAFAASTGRLWRGGRYIGFGLVAILVFIALTHYPWVKEMELEWRGDYRTIGKSYLEHRKVGDYLEMSAPDSAKILANLASGELGITFDSMLVRLSPDKIPGQVWYLLSDSVRPVSAPPRNFSGNGTARAGHHPSQPHTVVFSSGVLRLSLEEDGTRL